jgi:hypothetical protein
VLLPLAIVTCASLGTGASHAQSYLPLTVGNRWTYQGVNGLHEVQVITGTTTVLGRTFYVKSYLESSSNSGLENYWSEEADGDVLLGGFLINGVDTGGVIYDPPLRMLDAPLALGKTWTTRSAVYFLPAMNPGGTFDFTFTVFEDTTLSVPAGRFRALGIGQSPMLAMLNVAPHASLSLDGTLQTASGSPSDWYAAGVGVVQYDTDDRYQLVESALPTPVAVTSWGKLKRLYR